MPITPKKKVLFLITKGNWGGAQRAVFDLATSLPKERYEVVVACGAGDALPSKLAEMNIRCKRLIALGRNIDVSDFAAFREIFSLLKTERPDILHLHSSKAAFIGALAARLQQLSTFNFQLSTKVIFTVHGWPFKEPRSLLERSALWFASWLTALLSNAVIVLCRADFQSARRMPFIAHKMHLIPNGIVPPPFVERIEARNILAPDASECTALIITIAELTRNKGLPYALRAVSALSRETDVSPFRFIIIGEGELRQELEKIIAENNLTEVVRLAGFILNAKTILSGADIFLLPSLKEGLPYVLLEAGAAGLPVVATSVGGIPDIVDDMQNGILVRPKREKEIYDALRFLLVNRKRREEFGASLREKVLRDFGFEKMLKETVGVYEGR